MTTVFLEYGIYNIEKQKKVNHELNYMLLVHVLVINNNDRNNDRT